MRPSAKNGFLQERLSKLSPAPLSNHGLHYELPKHPSLRWATPGQGRHKVYGDSRRGGWAGHLWAVCWSLGPERWRRLVWRNLHTHTQRGQSRQWLETPEVSEIPGNELRVGKQEEASKAILGRPASSRSVRSPWTGGWREWRDSPPETGFQQDSPFLHWDLEKAPGQRELGGWRGGWIRRRGEGRQQGPRVRRRPEATGERLLPRQQLRSRSEKAFAGKDSRGGSDVREGKALLLGPLVWEALGSKVTHGSSELSGRNRENVHTGDTDTLTSLGAGRGAPETIRHSHAPPAPQRETHIRPELQRKLVRLLLYRLPKHTEHEERGHRPALHTAGTTALEEPRRGCLKVGLLTALRGRRNSPKEQSRPPCPPRPGGTALDHWLQQEMNGFIFLGNVLLKKISPGVRGERGAFMIQNPGETVQPSYPCSWSFAGV